MRTAKERHRAMEMATERDGLRLIRQVKAIRRWRHRCAERPEPDAWLAADAIDGQRLEDLCNSMGTQPSRPVRGSGHPHGIGDTRYEIWEDTVPASTGSTSASGLNGGQTAGHGHTPPYVPHLTTLVYERSKP